MVVAKGGSRTVLAPFEGPVPKILVADDNTNIQKMVSLAFEERGIDVVSVGNGEAAVRRIPDMNPDLVLADIFMPVRNGYEVCEFVKKDGRFSHVPVILLVGAFDPLDEKEARRVGADGVLKKPFVPPDPLIAMVISALEKNPKLAAELARAKEAPAPAPQPEPLPALEMPARAEIKPLPEYPEPETPEEAALVYGFGSGKRGNEDAAAEQRGPLSQDAEDEAEEEEHAEHGASSNDWRRNAMDFEVPEETSKSMAFALDEDNPSAMFPSEKDVPPKHVSPREVESTQIAPPNMDHDAQLTATMLGAPAPLAPPAAPRYVPPPPPPVSQKIEPLAAVPVVPAPIVPLPQVKASEPKVQAVEPVRAAMPVESVAEPELDVESVVEPPTFAARATHWMDAMTAALKTKDDDEWADPTPPVKLDLDAPENKLVAEAKTLVPPAAPVAQAPVPAPEELPLAQGIAAPEDDDFFAGEEEQPSTPLPLVSVTASKTILSDPALESSGPVPVGKLAADPELIAEPEVSAPLAKDPALVEPPSVRVTPEPLLVDESPASPGPSGYDERIAATEPAFTFSAPAEEAPKAAAPEPAPQPAAEAEPEVDERIPTGPVPNREVLATIPFLSPPPEILAQAAENNKAEDVDALVRKVMERLEPQLHDLLSQGVLKPLVENILHNEVAKKDR
jgi:CheY-like chemotaxis protein